MNWIGLYTMVRREVERTFRVVVQTLLSPAISASLYIFIFGFVIGGRIEQIDGVPYLTFVFPGILMLNVIGAAFGSSSSSVYFARFSRSIEEILIAPFSYFEMILGYLLGSVLRSLMVATLIVVVGLLFGAVSLMHPLLFICYIIAISAIFALLGILVGLWAQGFEQLTVLNTFIITPFTYLGGIFYSIGMLPHGIEVLTRLNPFFYFIDGIRGSMIGLHEASMTLGWLVILSLLLLLTTTGVLIFKKGWRIRA